MIDPEVALRGDQFQLSSALAPWLISHPIFSRYELLEEMGLTGHFQSRRGFLAKRLWYRATCALADFGFEPADMPQTYQATYRPDLTPTLTICARGFTLDRSALLPDAEEVELCLEWLEEFCQPMASVSEQNTKDLLKTCQEWFVHAGRRIPQQEGALQRALLQHGCGLLQDKGTRSARPRATFRKPEIMFRGRLRRPPAAAAIEAWFPREPARVKMPGRKEPGKMSVEERIIRFLDRRKQRSEVEFRPADLRPLLGSVVWPDPARMPAEVRQILINQGCVTYQKVVAPTEWRWRPKPPKQVRMWCRFSDMPETWRAQNAAKAKQLVTQEEECDVQ